MGNIANCKRESCGSHMTFSEGSDWDHVARNLELSFAAARAELELSGLSLWLSTNGRSIEEKLDRCRTAPPGIDREKAYVALSKVMGTDEMKRVLLVVERAKQLGFSAG
jgi:hypothetical protein